MSRDAGPTPTVRVPHTPLSGCGTGYSVKGLGSKEDRSGHPLLGVDRIEGPVAAYLDGAGEVFRVFGKQDSGCESYGVRLPDTGERWFVKTAVTGPARESLERGWAFHRAVRHPVIVPQTHRIAVGDDGDGGTLAVAEVDRDDAVEVVAVSVRGLADRAWMPALL